MEEITWEFDGRCPDCGSEHLETYELDGAEITECIKCGKRFLVIVDIEEALYY